MLALVCAVLPFVFSSCEETEELLGSMTVTIGEATYKIPDALFYGDNGNTYVASSNLKENVAIMFKGNSVGTYKLGLGEDLIEAAVNIGSISEMENTFVYTPTTGIVEEGVTAICGTLEITSYNTSKLIGTFEGYGLRTSLLSSGNIDWSNLEGNFVKINGTFEAVGRNTK